MSNTGNIKVSIKGPSKASIHKALEKYHYGTYIRLTYEKLVELCSRVLLEAVIANRKNPKAHQYTGNLINSIVVILFCRDTGQVDNFFAYNRVKDPISREMSSLTTRGGKRKRPYHFSPDWQNTPDSYYKPTVETDMSTGPSDARSFASTWTPSTNKTFEICIAYTSEYATWVEEHHKSTGYINSVAYTKRVLGKEGFKRSR